MRSVVSTTRARQTSCFTLALLFSLAPAARLWRVAAQQQGSPAAGVSAAPAVPTSGFKLERIPVAGGGELLTIFGVLRGDQAGVGQAVTLPLLSVLRDTLGDDLPDNDRLRYVWMHTFTKPWANRRAAAAVPFLYTRVGNQKHTRNEAPPPLIDLADPGRGVWHKLFWAALQSILIDPFGLPVKAAAGSFRRNSEDYRKAHVIRALAVLALYEADAGAQHPIFSPAETQEIQARLMLAQHPFGGLLDDINLRLVHQKQNSHWLDTRGQNWELLRQRAESEGLYFEPLQLPDGSATHALLWTTRADVEAHRGRKFDKRFLNISSPWDDERLRRWQGYSEPRYFDAENRLVASGTPGARSEEMIPLALYGLDHPRIPILLVDFRDNLNAKKREMSRRVLQDAAGAVLSLSGYQLPYFVGRAVYDFVTDRRGMDLNQPTRLRAYSQLKLLLALTSSLDPELRDETSRRLERVSSNPLENDIDAEARLAREQYAALVADAARPGGLPARLERDRREELVPLKHNQAERALFRLANLLSFGRYTHRERATLHQQFALLDVERRLTSHRRLLREVAGSNVQVEVQWDTGEVRRALEFIATDGQRADAQTASAIARIFARTEDESLRRPCLDGLHRIGNQTAKNVLVKIYRDPTIDARWRDLSAQYLRPAVGEQRRTNPNDAKIIMSIK